MGDERQTEPKNNDDDQRRRWSRRRNKSNSRTCGKTYRCTHCSTSSRRFLLLAWHGSHANFTGCWLLAAAVDQWRNEKQLRTQILNCDGKYFCESKNLVDVLFHFSRNVLSNFSRHRHRGYLYMTMANGFSSGFWIDVLSGSIDRL